MDAEALTVLRSIDASLKALVEIAQKRKGGATVDIDGPHGDPIVNAKDPRDWTGEPMKGRKFSECPPEYLDMLADRLDYYASQKDASIPEQARKQKFEMLDAGRARGWATRKRAGWTPPEDAAMKESEPQW